MLCVAFATIATVRGRSTVEGMEPDWAWLHADFAGYLRMSEEAHLLDVALTFHEWLRAQPLGYLQFHGWTPHAAVKLP
jgi:hypothetical protein